MLSRRRNRIQKRRRHFPLRVVCSHVHPLPCALQDREFECERRPAAAYHRQRQS
jgi:hypothetical protein